MAHFAEIDKNNIVLRIIVADQDFIDSGAVGDPKNWIQTSYNTQGNIHKLGGTPLRKNYAGVGFTYNKSLDAFIPPQPYKSWTLDEKTCTWNAPIEMPVDGTYEWDEGKLTWNKL